MKLIILAAGKGTRLMPLTQNTPKSLLHLKDGKTLLETQIDSIIKSGVIDEIVIVTGYRADQINAKIQIYEKTKNIKIKTLHNPFYESSNNLLSLWLARHEMDGPFIITNGDNIFSPDIFSGIVNKKETGILLTTVKIEEFNVDDMKVIEKNGLITKVSKGIVEEDASGESVGLVKISEEPYISVFKEMLETLARDEAYLNKFWLEVFNKLAKQATPIKPFEISRDKWLEFDVHFDLTSAQELIENGKSPV